MSRVGLASRFFYAAQSSAENKFPRWTFFCFVFFFFQKHPPSLHVAERVCTPFALVTNKKKQNKTKTGVSRFGISGVGFTGEFRWMKGAQ
jgi:hypothetical protein